MGLHIKEENLRDGHCRERQSDMAREQERGMKHSSERKGDRETDREDHSTGDSSKEVRKHLQSFLLSNYAFLEALLTDFRGLFKLF